MQNIQSQVDEILSEAESLSGQDPVVTNYGQNRTFAGLTGAGVKDPNFSLRLMIITVMSVMAFGAVLFWRSKLMLSAEYVEVPAARHLKQPKNKPLPMQQGAGQPADEQAEE